MKKNDIEELSYEDAFAQMEEILRKLENGNIKLDESLELYEKGIKLYRRCNLILENAQLKITQFDENQEEKEVK